jgi:hypothetical protein
MECLPGVFYLHNFNDNYFRSLPLVVIYCANIESSVTFGKNNAAIGFTQMPQGASLTSKGFA